jgi:hypothetical protein
MIWLLYILADSLANCYLIENRKTVPNYIVLFLIRAICAIIYGAYVLDVHEETFLLWLGQVTLPFPFFFNTLLNTWRRKDIDYVGEHSGWIDSFVFKHKLQRPYFWLTFILFVIAVKYLM